MTHTWQTFRESFKLRKGRYPNAREWDAFWDSHPTEWPHGGTWAEAKARGQRAIKEADKYWEGQKNGGKK